MRKARLLAAALGALGSAACNQVFGIENGALIAAPDDGGSTDDAVATDDAGSTDDSSSADSAPPRSDKLYPLGAGYTWSYDVVALGDPARTCASGTYDVSVDGGASTLDGKQAYQIGVICAPGVTQTVAPDDTSDTIYLRGQSEWLTLLDGTLSEGEMWQYVAPFTNSAFTVTWHRETSVTVPAGTFTDCWTANQNESAVGNNYNTYCRGIGLVHSYATDANGTGYEGKLTKTNLSH